MSAERVTYVDSSALVKLIVAEPESEALRQHLRRRRLVSSAVARAEVARAVAAHRAARRDAVLARIDLVRITDSVLRLAGSMLPLELRTLDAIHLATATRLGPAVVDAVVTYDSRLAAAAQAQGWVVRSPS